MNIDWDGYVRFDPETPAPPQALPRVDARQAFQQCMNSKGVRLEMLDKLLHANGVELTRSDMSIQALNDWFSANLEADPEEPGRLGPIWYSVCHDVALFLGDVMIERHPSLRWEFFVWGKRNVAFQRHVIMGFSTEDPKLHTNIDIDRMVAGYAHQIIEARGSVPDYGTVEVRGTSIDVEAVAARYRHREVDRQAFQHWLNRAAERA